MPFRSIAKLVCVFYALLISVYHSDVANAQGYADMQSRSGRPVGGIVDQLSRGQSPVSRDQSTGALRQAEYSTDIRGGTPNAGSLNAGALNAGSGFYPRDLRGGGDSVVALRPQPMSVQQANFESNDSRNGFLGQQETKARSREELDRMNAEHPFQSFIDRENASPKEEAKAETSQMITRIGINLAFVLALGVGAILMFRQFQKGKSGARNQTPADLAGLKIDQVLQVTRGVSLYLVDSMASKILVAVDAGGIKSVNVLPSRFEDELEEPEAFSRHNETSLARSGGAERSRSRRSINKSSSTDIDENLIKMLLSKSKEAA